MTDGFFEDEVSVLGLLILLLTRDGLPILFYTFSVSGRTSHARPAHAKSSIRGNLHLSGLYARTPCLHVWKGRIFYSLNNMELFL